MKNSKLIPVIVFRDTNSGEADEVFRLDKHGEEFFQNCLLNVERNRIHHLCIEEWTKDQWRRAELVGLSVAGEISYRQQKQLDELNKKLKTGGQRVWPS